MQFRTYKVVSHRDCTIYLRSIGNMFEYLAVIEGQIYTRSVTVRPRVRMLLLSMLGLKPGMYNDAEINAVLSMLTDIAKKNIDAVLDAPVTPQEDPQTTDVPEESNEEVKA